MRFLLLIGSFLLVAPVVSHEQKYLPLHHVHYSVLQADSETDFVDAFHALFDTVKVQSLLEFGVSNATGYFLQHAHHVASFIPASFYTQEKTLQMYDAAKDSLLKYYPNWAHAEHVVINHTHNATKASVEQVEYTLTQEYFHEIEQACSQAIALAKEPPQAVFVNSAPFGRADILNVMFQKRIPFICAHDTNIQNPLYGWQRLHVPRNYIAISFPSAVGCILWVNKEVVTEQKIQRLQNYARIAYARKLPMKR